MSIRKRTELKIAAIFRYEPKDLADIWIIASKRAFNWRKTISDALLKEGAVDPVFPAYMPPQK